MRIDSSITIGPFPPLPKISRFSLGQKERAYYGKCDFMGVLIMSGDSLLEYLNNTRFTPFKNSEPIRNDFIYFTFKFMLDF